MSCARSPRFAGIGPTGLAGLVRSYGVPGVLKAPSLHVYVPSVRFPVSHPYPNPNPDPDSDPDLDPGCHPTPSSSTSSSPSPYENETPALGHLYAPCIFSLGPCAAWRPWSPLSSCRESTDSTDSTDVRPRFLKKVHACMSHDGVPLCAGFHF